MIIVESAQAVEQRGMLSQTTTLEQAISRPSFQILKIDSAFKEALFPQPLSHHHHMNPSPQSHASPASQAPSFKM